MGPCGCNQSWVESPVEPSVEYRVPKLDAQKHRKHDVKWQESPHYAAAKQSAARKVQEPESRRERDKAERDKTEPEPSFPFRGNEP